MKTSRTYAERRVTFIIRLTVDEQGQPRRTEIEHAQSGQGEHFARPHYPYADGAQAYMPPPSPPRQVPPPLQQYMESIYL